MSTVPTLQRDPVSGVIYMHWTEPTPRGKRGRSRRQSTRTTDMAAAKAFLGEWLLMEKSRPTDGSAVYTVADLWALYFERHIQKNAASATTAEYSWKNLSQHFGMLKLSDVSQDEVEKYEALRARGTIGRFAGAQATVRKELLALRACFNWCAKPIRKIIKKDEIPAFELPPPSEPRDRWLREDEIRRLLAAAAEYSAARGQRMHRGERFIHVALQTAARSEAIRQLTWDRVDWQVATIDFNVPGRRRTKKRRTVVPISKALLEPLRRMHQEREGDFLLDHDEPILADVYAIAKLAKLDDVSPHVLRHTAATHMARRGVPLWHIAKVLGNSIDMVERVYAKHCPEDLREAVDTISGEAMGVRL